MSLPSGLESRFRTLGFSDGEAKVYLALLGAGEANGSRLAAACGLARTTAYAALESLLRRGAVLQTLGEPRTFRARPPATLFEELAARASEDAAALAEALASMKSEEERGEVWNVGNEASLVSKALAMIEAARREILLNTDYFLEVLRPALGAAAARGVRVVHFAYSRKRAEIDGVLTVRRYGASGGAPTADVRHRLMLVADMSSCLVASREPSGCVFGISTADTLLVRVMAEHIHHDIYLTRIAERAGRAVIDDGTMVGSLLEAECD